MWGDKFEDRKTVYQVEIAPYLLVALYRVGGVASLKDGVEKTLDLIDISDELRNRRSGQYQDLYMSIQIRFVMSILRRADYIKATKDSSKVGSWELTAKGTEKAHELSENSEDAKIVKELRSEVQEIWKKHLQDKKQAREEKLSQGEESIEEEASDADEAELVELTEQESIRTDLQAIHDNLKPYEFEHLCVRLLNAMGAKVEVTQESNDRGIDARGYIEVNLIIFEVVAQFKRHDLGSPVGESYIDRLAGSKAKLSADRGIFITTSYYSKNAKEAAERHSIRLINGEQLVGLMRKHEIMYKRVLDLKS